MQPLKTLARQRPIPNIFNAYTLLTVSLQFAVHFGCLIYVVREAQATVPRSVIFSTSFFVSHQKFENVKYLSCSIYFSEKVDMEAEFKPNLLNSAVYLMALALQVSTFAVNYRVGLIFSNEQYKFFISSLTKILFRMVIFPNFINDQIFSVIFLFFYRATRLWKVCWKTNLCFIVYYFRDLLFSC